MLQACFIGTFFTFWPGLLENFLVYTYETDGAADACNNPRKTPSKLPFLCCASSAVALRAAHGLSDWTCAEFIGDPAAPEYEGLQLPTCKPGLCTWVPDGLDGRDNVTGAPQTHTVCHTHAAALSRSCTGHHFPVSPKQLQVVVLHVVLDVVLVVLSLLLLFSSILLVTGAAT